MSETVITGERTIIEHEIQSVGEEIPTGAEHSREYEDFLRVVVNALFIGHLGEGRLQTRTEPDENDGIEIRDIICQNRAEVGFWKDLKDKWGKMDNSQRSRLFLK